MKQTIILLTIILISVVSTSAQTIILNGEQIIDSKKNTPVLSCTPIKITKSMKISKVKGHCNGFWIQKGSETTHKFTNFEDPIGVILTPGIYYVYPHLKKEAKKANVSVTLKAQNT